MDLQHHAFDTPAAGLQALAKVQEQEEEQQKEQEEEQQDEQEEEQEQEEEVSSTGNDSFRR